MKASSCCSSWLQDPGTSSAEGKEDEPTDLKKEAQEDQGSGSGALLFRGWVMFRFRFKELAGLLIARCLRRFLREGGAMAAAGIVGVAFR